MCNYEAHRAIDFNKIDRKFGIDRKFWDFSWFECNNGNKYFTFFKVPKYIKL